MANQQFLDYFSSLNLQLNTNVQNFQAQLIFEILQVYKLYVGFDIQQQVDQNAIQRKNNIEELFQYSFLSEYLFVRKFVSVQSSDFNYCFFKRIDNLSNSQKESYLRGLQNSVFQLLLQLHHDGYILCDFLGEICQNKKQLSDLFISAVFQKIHLANLIRSIQNNPQCYKQFYIRVFYSNVNDSNINDSDYNEIMDYQYIFYDNNIMQDQSDLPLRCLTLNFNDQTSSGSSQLQFNDRGPEGSQDYIPQNNFQHLDQTLYDSNFIY